MTNWWKLHGGNLDSDANTFDRYQGPEGAATVFRNGRQLFGFTLRPGGTERPWGPVPVPPQGNVQAARIFPEGDHWSVYVITDINDQHRAEFGMAVAPL